MSGPTMTAVEVAAMLGYRHRDGRPNSEVVRKLARAGHIPPPIDAALSVVWWRWSRGDVAAYVAGQWDRGGAA